MSENNKNSQQEVMSAAWRKSFLESVCSLDQFNVLVDESAGLPVRHPSPEQLEQLNAAAQRLISGYDRKELVVARQSYNNEHVLEFWKFYSQECQRLLKSGTIAHDFPLFSVTPDFEGLDFDARAIPVTRFDEDDFLCQTVGASPADVPRDGLERLWAKLVVLHRIQNATIQTLYRLLINKARLQGTAVWDYYRIHYFLDNNLYQLGNGAFYRSPFSFVFFNTNLLELKLYLEFHIRNAAEISLTTVQDFLERQREYYLRLALSVSSEENEIHNRRRDLCRYDPEDGVVKDQFTDALKNHYHETVVHACGMIKLDGCPFARTKGLRKNALIEVFEYFDRMMVHLLEHSVEFRALSATGPHGAGRSGSVGRE